MIRAALDGRVEIIVERVDSVELPSVDEFAPTMGHLNIVPRRRLAMTIHPHGQPPNTPNSYTIRGEFIANELFHEQFGGGVFTGGTPILGILDEIERLRENCARLVRERDRILADNERLRDQLHEQQTQPVGAGMTPENMPMTYRELIDRHGYVYQVPDQAAPTQVARPTKRLIVTD